MSPSYDLVQLDKRLATEKLIIILLLFIRVFYSQRIVTKRIKYPNVDYCNYL